MTVREDIGQRTKRKVVDLEATVKILETAARGFMHRGDHVLAYGLMHEALYTRRQALLLRGYNGGQLTEARHEARTRASQIVLE